MSDQPNDPPESEPLEADAIYDADGYTPLSENEKQANVFISEQAERLRRQRMDAPPVQISPQGDSGPVIQSFFSTPLTSGGKIGATRVVRFDRTQTVIANSAVAALQRMAPDEWKDAFDRFDQAVVEICRIFSGVKPEDLTAANTGRANIDSAPPEE